MVDVLHLTSDELADLAPPRAYVDAVREAYRAHGEGRAVTHPRETLARPGDGPGGILTGYKAILPDQRAMGGYMYDAGFDARDAWFALPLFDARSGEPLAILDGASINPLKTGAASAVAVDALARDDAAVLGIVGSGSQARGQLRCIATVRDLDEVRVFSPTADHRRRFAEEMGRDLDLPVHAVGSAAEALADAGIAVTATTSHEPVLAAEDLADGVHLTIMGQYHPRRREVDAATVASSVYVPDLRERVHRDAGAFLLAVDEGVVGEDHVHASLGEVVAGTAPGRTSAADRTLFDSGGTALETVASARMLYDRAVEAGLGTTVTFTSASEGMDG